MAGWEREYILGQGNDRPEPGTRAGGGKEGAVKRKIGIAFGIAGILLAAAALVFAVAQASARKQREKLISDRGPVTVVVFADSIWDMVRDETGIAAVLERELEQARIYNCAIMGSSAAFRQQGENETAEETEGWNKKSLAGILTRTEGLTTVTEETGVQDVPLAQADYFVIAYGLNDYFCAVPRESGDAHDLYSYAGVLRTAVERLREINPQAKILLLSQTYCQGYSYGKVDSESDYKDYGAGTGPDYVSAMEKVAEETGCIFVNNYRDMGINIHNGPKYLSDATHLTAYGRRKYAVNLAKYLLEDYEECLRP